MWFPHCWKSWTNETAFCNREILISPGSRGNKFTQNAENFQIIFVLENGKSLKSQENRSVRKSRNQVKYVEKQTCN